MEDPKPPVACGAFKGVAVFEVADEFTNEKVVGAGMEDELTLFTGGAEKLKDEVPALK